MVIIAWVVWGMMNLVVWCPRQTVGWWEPGDKDDKERRWNFQKGYDGDDKKG